MVRLRVLGSPSFEGIEDAAAAGQRKSIALLALLAEAAPRALSRDRVAAYLWPETDSRTAFHRLNQLLHALRRALDASALFLKGPDLKLNLESLTSDVTEFRAAARAGSWEQAAGLYGGPFLDGFFLRGAREFEGWLETTRAALRREYTDVLETLATEATARGDTRSAARWWRRLAELDPFSSRVAIHLMSALAAAGDRAGALDLARSYQTMVGSELGAAPNPAVLSLAARLRRSPAHAAAPPEPAHRGTVTLALLPWSDLGTPGGVHDGFASGVLDDLATALSRVDGIQVLDRRSAAALAAQAVGAREFCERLGAVAILEGTLRWAGDRVRITVQLVSTADGCYRWSERYDRKVTDPFAAQDELTASIVAALAAPLAALRPA